MEFGYPLTFFQQQGKMLAYPVKYLNNYWMHFHEIFCRRSWSSEDESE